MYRPAEHIEQAVVGILKLLPATQNVQLASSMCSNLSVAVSAIYRNDGHALHTEPVFVSSEVMYRPAEHIAHVVFGDVRDRVSPDSSPQ
jgi:hypothetical protein